MPGLKYAHVYRDNWTRLNVRPAKIMQVWPVMYTLHIILSSSCHWPTKLSSCLEVGNFLFIAVVVQCYPWFKFCFSLFWGMNRNEFKTKEKYSQLLTFDLQPLATCPRLLYLCAILLTKHLGSTLKENTGLWSRQIESNTTRCTYQ